MNAGFQLIDVRSSYEKNWSSMEGLQMSEIVAKAGYEMVSKLHKGKALDIGCGDGENAQVLKKMGFHIEGCDISKNAVDKARKRGIVAKQVNANEFPLPYSKHFFELIWLSDVIEHVFLPDKLLMEINRILKPNGFLFVSTPNASWWGIRVQILAGKIMRDVHPEHVWWFNLTYIRHSLISAGFSVKTQLGYNCLIPHPITLRWPILKKLNKIGNHNDLLSYTTLIFAQKR